MTDRRRIEFTTDMDSRGFERGARTIRDRFRDMGKAFQDNGVVGLSQFSQMLGISGRDVVDFAMRAGQAVIDFTKMGEAVERVALSFETIFGPASSKLRAQLDETRRSMGLSRSEMESMLLPMGQMATNAGFAGDAAGQLAGKLLTMAGDVAAFNPTVGDANEALGAMQAALRGEFDPLERFGSKLSAARVKAEAARLRGVDPMNASLSEQQLQIMAVVSLLENDFAPALGTLERQEGTATDSVNELSAAWKDMQEEWGRAANDVLPPLISKLADLTGEQANARASGDGWQRSAENVGMVLQWMFSPVNALRRGIFDTSSEIDKQAGLMDSNKSKFQEFGNQYLYIADAIAAARDETIGIADDTEEAERRVAAAVDRWVGVLGNLQAAYERTAARAAAEAFLAPGGGDDRGPEGPEFGRRTSNASNTWNQINGTD